jgi:hypothetical protein
VAALDTTFASLSFPDQEAQFMDPGQSIRNGLPGLVLESGSTGGVAWNLVAFFDGKEPMLEVEQVGGASSGAGGLSRTSPSRDQLDTTLSFLVRDDGSRPPHVAGAVVYGAVGDGVARAEALGSGSRVVRTPARIFAPPPSLGIDQRPVVGSVEGAVQMAYTVGYRADGSSLGEPDYETGSPEVVARGTDPVGGNWTVSATPTTSGASLSLEVPVPEEARASHRLGIASSAGGRAEASRCTSSASCRPTSSVST